MGIAGESGGSSIDRAGYEKRWANEAARLNLNETDKAAWNACRHTIRPFVYFDKILVAWQVVKGEPHIKEIYNVTAVDGSFQNGLWLRMQTKIAQGPEIVITHTPRRLGDLDVFTWLPYFNELRFCGQDWDNPTAPKNLRLSACFKMADRPDRPFRERCDYVSELHHFRDRFPQYAKTRF